MGEMLMYQVYCIQSRCEVRIGTPSFPRVFQYDFQTTREI